MDLNNVLIVFHNDRNNLPALSTAEDTLKGKRIHYSVIDRIRLNKKVFLGKDLVITIGGDGTFLRTSHFNERVPMLGFNSNPKEKEGFVIRSNKEKFPGHLDRIITGDYTITELTRLECRINGRILKELALNDLFIGRRKAYTLFSYELTVSGKTEYQRSSGVICSTAIGSNAWMKSAGGKVIDYREKHRTFQYLTREPYLGSLNIKAELITGVLRKGETLKIHSVSPDAIVVFDSIGHEHKMHKGETAEVCISENTLKFIEF